MNWSKVRRLTTDHRALSPNGIKLEWKEWDHIAAVVEAAKCVLASTDKVYSGTPGKLDWPEYHMLRQALEILESE